MENLMEIIDALRGIDKRDGYNESNGFVGYLELHNSALTFMQGTGDAQLIAEVVELRKKHVFRLAKDKIDRARRQAYKKGATELLKSVEDYLKISGVTLEEIGSNQAEFDELMRVSVNWDNRNAQARAAGHPNSRTW